MPILWPGSCLVLGISWIPLDARMDCFAFCKYQFHGWCGSIRFCARLFDRVRLGTLWTPDVRFLSQSRRGMPRIVPVQLPSLFRPFPLRVRFPFAVVSVVFLSFVPVRLVRRRTLSSSHPTFPLLPVFSGLFRLSVRVSFVPCPFPRFSFPPPSRMGARVHLHPTPETGPFPSLPLAFPSRKGGASAPFEGAAGAPGETPRASRRRDQGKGTSVRRRVAVVAGTCAGAPTWMEKKHVDEGGRETR